MNAEIASVPFTQLMDSPYWLTHLNDLRPDYASGQPRDRTTFLRELKLNALFYPSCIIRDADVVNHMDLLDAIEHDAFDIRNAIEHGTIRFALRAGAHSFSDVNDRAGINRAFPGRYAEAKRPVKVLDEYLSEHLVPVLEIPNLKQDCFRKGLLTLCNSDYLSGRDRDLLREGISAAESASNGGLLRFGSVFHFLYRQRACPINGDLIQLCRAAHVMAVAHELNIPIATTNADIPVQRAAAALGYASAPHEGLWECEYLPKKFIVGTQLGMFDSASFLKVQEMRKHGRSTGYFATVSRIVGRDARKPTLNDFEDYFRTLNDYINAICTDLKVQITEIKCELNETQGLALNDLLRVKMDRHGGAAMALSCLIGIGSWWIGSQMLGDHASKAEVETMGSASLVLAAVAKCATEDQLKKRLYRNAMGKVRDFADFHVANSIGLGLHI